MVQEWDGRLNFGMSNSVTTAIRESVRDMAIGKTRTTGKADRATVEQAIDPRTRMVLFKMLNGGVFHDINGCISTGKEVFEDHFGSWKSIMLYWQTCTMQQNLMVRNLLSKCTKLHFWFLSRMVF